MNKTSSFLFLFALIAVMALTGCKETDKDASVTFGANYHVVNCITNVTVYLDGKNLGRLQGYTDSITVCGLAENITESITPGKHSYKVEIRPETGNGCKKDITGTFSVKSGECYKIFIDYLKIDW